MYCSRDWTYWLSVSRLGDGILKKGGKIAYSINDKTRYASLSVECVGTAFSRANALHFSGYSAAL